MTIYTAAELAAVQQAIVDLVGGLRVTSITIGDKTVAYGPAQIKDLQALRDAMKVEINTTSTTRRFVLTSTDKGL